MNNNKPNDDYMTLNHEDVARVLYHIVVNSLLAPTTSETGLHIMDALVNSTGISPAEAKELMSDFGCALDESQATVALNLHNW